VTVEAADLLTPLAVESATETVDAVRLTIFFAMDKATVMAEVTNLPAILVSFCVAVIAEERKCLTVFV
jgi:hypothetical protein